jgi:hypothetical protein
MTKMRTFLGTTALFSAVFAVTPAAAASGYVNTAEGYLALSPESKAAYVQGLNDALNYIFVDDSLVTALAKRGRLECLVNMETNSSLLADRLTMAYRDPKFQSLAPTAVYIIKMGETCKTYINQERAKFGLGPQ